MCEPLTKDTAMIYEDADGDKYEPCGACDDGKAYHIAIYGTKNTYAEHVCGRCGKPLCTDCADDSTWRWDGYPCCWVCCAELDDER